MANTPTTNIALNKPAAGDPSWDVTLNADLDTIDAQFAGSGTAHSHNGTAGKGPKLSQANTHESPDTDASTSALHHTLGTGANQAAAGNHTHSGVYEPALGNPGTNGYVLSSTTGGVRSWVAPGSGGGGDPASATHAATSKATPVDADELPLVDSAASNALKKLTWANLKATAKTYFDTLYAAVTHTHAASDLTSGTVATARLGSGTADATTYLRGDNTWATPSGGGGGGITTLAAATDYPLTAGGDLLLGAAAGADYARATAGATIACNRTAGGGAASNAIDGSDSTKSEPIAAVAGTIYTLDLGTARAIANFRLLQETAGSAWRATDYTVQSSPDNTTWTTRHTMTAQSAVSDSGTVALSSGSITARYWRLNASTGGANGWNVFTISLFSASTAGAPVRLAVGANGTVPVADSTAANGIAWATPLKVLASATVGTTQVTIAHSLGYTPTIVQPQMTSDGRVWRSANPDSTNIYLTADAAGRTCLPMVR